MARLIIFVYGYDGPESNNANAICVHNMIGYLKSCLDITIITTTEKRSYKRPQRRWKTRSMKRWNIWRFLASTGARYAAIMRLSA